jgi:hypothetical protein
MHEGTYVQEMAQSYTTSTGMKNRTLGNMKAQQRRGNMPAVYTQAYAATTQTKSQAGCVHGQQCRQHAG